MIQGFDNDFDSVRRFGKIKNYDMESYLRFAEHLWFMFPHFDSVIEDALLCKTKENMDAISDWIEKEHIADRDEVSEKIL